MVIADPRFGSTSFHVAALYALAGDEKMDDFFRRLKANDVRIVDGNSVVRDMVARGEVKVGLTDTDDVNVALESGLPIAMVLPDSDGLGVPVMPNMVSLIANAPHPEEGRSSSITSCHPTSSGSSRVGSRADPAALWRARSQEHPGDRHVQADDARLREGGRARRGTRRNVSQAFLDSECGAGVPVERSSLASRVSSSRFAVSCRLRIYARHRSQACRAPSRRCGSTLVSARCSTTQRSWASAPLCCQPRLAHLSASRWRGCR